MEKKEKKDEQRKEKEKRKADRAKKAKEAKHAKGLWLVRFKGVWNCHGHCCIGRFPGFDS